MSSVGPTSTTADLAGKAPLEKSGSSDLPGAFPETPGLETGDFSVNPLPATDGASNPIKLAPGEKVPHPESFTGNTLTSGVHDDPELVAADKAKGESEPTFSVSPLPAFAGGVNPIKSTPGESIPHPSSLTQNTIQSGVRTDKESYENSGGLGTAPVLPDVVTPQAERDANGTGVLDLPPISKNLIPESSLPMGDAGGSYDASPFVQSAGATSTTAALAGAVPLESTKVPEVVKESQEKAGVDPEASAIPEEVKEKSAVEKELLKEVPVAPSTSEGTAGKETPDKTEKAAVTAGEAAAAVGGAAAALGGAAYAYASGAASKLPESVTSKLPVSIQNSINETNGQKTAAPTELAKDTPEVVKESIAESGQAPEAASNEEAVLDKKAVEKELLKEVKTENSTGESAPKIASTEPKTTASEPKSVATLKTPATPLKPESRDVSPGTIPGSHTATPVVTSGIDSKTVEPVTPSSSKAPAADSSPAAGTTTAEKKKKHRISAFFGKLTGKGDKK